MKAAVVFKQPLLWFVIVGLALFVADSQLSDDSSEIIVTPALRDRLATLWTTQTGLIATESELNALVDNWVKEEVLYQEALRLGLDQEDSIVRRRLVQKLGFIAESEIAPAPELGQLEQFYQQHLADYTLPERYSLQQLYFQQLADAEHALTQINAGTEAQELGESSMLNPSYAYRSALDLNATFGAGFSDQLASLEVGRWQGPLQSGFGFHLLFINAVHPEQVTPLEAVQQQVLLDYQRAQQINARDIYIDRLLENYSIIVETQ